MRILLTGAGSGIGQALNEFLRHDHLVTAPTRDQLDLASPDQVRGFVTGSFDMLINCAGTGVGGKIDFANHKPEFVEEILQVNLLSAVSLTQQILSANPATKIVNITSTNNKQYYANDLAYSLSKKALSDFTSMLKIEYPSTPVLEVRVGLTRTNFNQNRYRHEPDRYQDIYHNPCQTPEHVAYEIAKVLFNNSVTFIEIAP
jgi:short-subunit dehydrogenase